MKKLIVLLILSPALVAADDNRPIFTGNTNSIFYSQFPPTGDIIFETGGGMEVLRFKAGGIVVANPKLKPDEAARLVLSAMYQLAPRFFCRNPDDPSLKKDPRQSETNITEHVVK